MNYWYFKSEPNCWSWNDHLKSEKKIAEWDGVKNYQARNNMIKMKKGDLGLFYHSGGERVFLGVVKVVKEHYPDHTAENDDRWEMVDLKALTSLKKPISLREIKEHPLLEDMALVKQGRLSVGPMTEKEFHTILQLGDSKL